MRFVMRHRFAPFIILAIVLCIALWPLFRNGFFVSDDGEWMVIRLSAFYQSLAGGQFPVRYLGRLYNSYGYPVSNFLYPGYLYIGSVIHAVGLTYVDSVKTIIILSVAVGTLAIAGSLTSVFSRTAALFGAASYALAPYLLFDIYTRGSVGEILAMSAAACAVYAITKFRPLLLVPSVAMLILAHNTAAILLSIPIFLLILSRRGRTPMIIGSLIGAGLSAFFWLPALFERGYVRFDSVMISDPETYFVSPENALILGFAVILSLVLVGRHTGRRHSANIALFAVVSLFGWFMALPLSTALWDADLVRKLVQFPFRFLMLPTVFGPWIVAAALDTVSKDRRLILLGILAVVLIGGTIPAMSGIRYVVRDQGYYETNEGTTTVADEYLPEWIQERKSVRPVETIDVIAGDADISPRTFIGERFEFIADVRSESVLQINKLYYPGWGVTVDGNLLPIDYSEPSGVMRVTIPAGIHTVKAAFRETPFRFIADVLSIGSIVAYGSMVAFRRKFEK